MVEVLEVRFDRVPDGLKEAVQAILDQTMLRSLLRAAIKSTGVEAQATDCNKECEAAHDKKPTLHIR